MINSRCLPSIWDGSGDRWVRYLPSLNLVVFRGPPVFTSDDLMIMFLCKMKRDFLVAEMQEKHSPVDGDIEDELEMGLSYSIYLLLSICLLSREVYLDNLILLPVSFLK